ncbi:MAG: hypothetical protein KF708_15675 [Pirellulales bacterium]|nr:hypothetical protein [Pirellulales bacterium]
MAMRQVWLAAWVCVLVLVTAAGCSQDSNSSAGKQSSTAAAVGAGLSRDLHAFAIDNLDHLDEFDSQEMMKTIIVRLNQWIDLQKKATAEPWQPDAAINGLPPEFARVIALHDLAAVKFSDLDASFLQEVVWLRNISRVARGHEADPLAQATHLFDWVVRNVQLDADGKEGPRRLPFQTLLVGHGTAVERAWLFILLARQQQLDVVMLALPAKDGSGKLEPWLPALFENNQLYLFDPRLGLPVPGPGGQGVATLEQVVADESLLRQLDLDEQHRYPIDAARLQGVVALAEASPLYLARRMSLFESQMAGDNRLLLSTDPTDLIARLKNSPHVSDAKLWNYPYEVQNWQGAMTAPQREALLRDMVPFFAAPVQTPKGAVNPLWRGRIHHFKGDFDGEESASFYYQLARPSDDEIEAANLQGELREVYVAGKRDASYWLGLVAFDRGMFEQAEAHLKKRTLEATPSGPWTYGARYNLARTYEELGKLPEAIELYSQDSSPQQHGNKLRGKWLKESPDADASENEQPAADAPAEGEQDSPSPESADER